MTTRPVKEFLWASDAVPRPSVDSRRYFNSIIRLNRKAPGAVVKRAKNGDVTITRNGVVALIRNRQEA